MITHENYEAFLIDYLEGNLDDELTMQLELFISQNPELKNELSGFEDVSVSVDYVSFHEKRRLYKTADDERLRDHNNMVAYLEGDMDVVDSKAFEEWLAASPEKREEYGLFEKTRLTPDYRVKFPKKQELYRKSLVIRVIRWSVGVAAALALAWGVNTVLHERVPLQPSLTQHNPTTETPIPDRENARATLVPIAENKVQTSSVQNGSQAAKIQQIARDSADILLADTFATAQNTLAIPSDTLLAIAPRPVAEQLFSIAESIPLVVNPTSSNETTIRMTPDEFLAMQTRKLGKESVLSVHKVAQIGLNLLSLFTGERLGYQTKDGKITSINIDSELVAFTIPLEKNK